jgi:formyltetrahydrofolate-dependent phosphoribosylglycinamide formyltransferase
MKRLVVMISGGGTNLQAIIDAIGREEINASVVLVVSNRRGVYGLARAEHAGIETLYFPLKPYTDSGKQREEYDRDLADHISTVKPDLIVLAGWMHILSAAFLERFPDRVINLHPALPEQFPGIKAIERAYSAFQRGEVQHSGCMVHRVIPELDAGPVIVQRIVPIFADDSHQAFEARMHASEHEIIVEAIQKIMKAVH